MEVSSFSLSLCGGMTAKDSPITSSCVGARALTIPSYSVVLSLVIGLTENEGSRATEAISVILGAMLGSLGGGVALLGSKKTTRAMKTSKMMRSTDDIGSVCQYYYRGEMQPWFKTG
jgi:hypothetical protein